MQTEFEHRRTDDRLEYIDVLEKKARMQECLPHIYGHKFYQWSYEYFHSINKFCFIVAGNQLGKSYNQIRKAIHWATEPSLWPKLWAERPTQFWYFYPNFLLCQIEFDEKWIKELLPREEYKSHPQYGWKTFNKAGVIAGVRFNSGVTIYFKTYEQASSAHSASSVYAIFADEEMPEHLYSEIIVRLNATNGYFSKVFTAIYGQEMWRRTMEERGTHELFPDAFKRCVSLYDCQYYIDGTPSQWTDERIEQIKQSCADQTEIDRRVYGKFVVEKGRVFDGFVRAVNVVKGHPLPKEWVLYSGIDWGSGGDSHPSAIVFVAVSPDFKQGRIFRSWRGDGIRTTSLDLVQKYIQLKGDMRLVGEYYDYSQYDVGAIAQQLNVNLQKADKKRDHGISLLNSLFKNGMLKIHDDDPENMKIVVEAEQLTKNTYKTKANDDLCFHGSTLIYTSSGLIPIRLINIGDLVLTRYGFRKVINKFIREDKTFLYKINCRFIRCTDNHKFFTDKGFKAIRDLTKKDELFFKNLFWYLKCLSAYLLNLMVTRLEDIQNLKEENTDRTIHHQEIIEQSELKFFIGKFGKVILDQYQKITLFITRMAILMTIGLKILSVFIKAFIYLIMEMNALKILFGMKKLENILIKLGILQKNGMDQKKVTYGIKNMAKKYGKIFSLLLNHVIIAAKNTKRLNMVLFLDFVRMLANQHIVEKSKRIIKKEFVQSVLKYFRSINILKLRHVPSHVEDYTELSQNVKVYNITVYEHHEYFANGFLVSNCDATRYAISNIPWNFSGIFKGKKESKDKYDGLDERQINYLKMKSGELTPFIDDDFTEWQELIDEGGGYG